MKSLKLKLRTTTLLLYLFAIPVVHGAGQPVNEDMTLLHELSQDMIEYIKEGNLDGFMKAYKPAMRLAGEGRNNSIVLPRACAKFRAAKKAVVENKFDKAIEVLTDAQQILLWKKERPWNGLLN